MNEEERNIQINTVHTEAKFMQDQIQAKTGYNKDVENFMELEKKKYKKADTLNDIINRD